MRWFGFRTWPILRCQSFAPVFDEADRPKSQASAGQIGMFAFWYNARQSTDPFLVASCMLLMHIQNTATVQTLTIPGFSVTENWFGPIR